MAEVKDQINLIIKDPLVADDSVSLNVAIASGGKFLLQGAFTISNPIKVKSNTTLEFTNGSSLTLNNSANCYAIMNDDMTNGNVNITIQNFKLYGNGDNQTRSYNGDAKTGYYGFGMMFYLVDGLKILDGYVEKTNAWGIAHFSYNNFEFKRLRFNQRTIDASNGDGVTGTSSNGVIEDMSGYTCDDMVALTTSGGTLHANPTGMPDVAISNVIIRNIKPEKTGAYTTWIAIGLYSKLNLAMSNVTVENVKGFTKEWLVRIMNYWPDEPEGIFNDITFDGLERYNDANTVDREVILLGTGNYDTLKFKNIKTIGTAAQTKSYTSIALVVNITNLIFENVFVTNNHPTGAINIFNLAQGTSNIKNIFASNVNLINTAGTTQDHFLTKISNPNLTRVYAHNVRTSGTEVYSLAIDANIGMNAPGVRGIATRLFGATGDMIVDAVGNAPKYYNGTAWVSLV